MCENISKLLADALKNDVEIKININFLEKGTDYSKPKKNGNVYNRLKDAIELATPVYLSLSMCDESEIEYNEDDNIYHFTAFGGQNGHGNANAYLRLFPKMMDRLKEILEDGNIWIDTIEFDNTDDVFYIKFGYKC